MGLLDNITKNLGSLKHTGVQKASEIAFDKFQPKIDAFVHEYGINAGKASAAQNKVKSFLERLVSGKLSKENAKKELRGPILNSLLEAATTTTKSKELVEWLQERLKQGKAAKLYAMLPSSVTDSLSDEITNVQQQLVNKLIGMNGGDNKALKETNSYVTNIDETQKEKITEDDYERRDNGVVVVTEETTEEQDKAFIDSLMKVKAPKAATPLQTGQAALEAVNSLWTMSNEVMKFTEVQKTKRTQINAEKEVALARIEATSKLLEDYLQKTHDERSEIFKKQFEVIDHALKSGNVQELALTLNAMNDLAKSSPFKNLADVGQVQNLLQAEDTEFDF